MAFRDVYNKIIGIVSTIWTQIEDYIAPLRQAVPMFNDLVVSIEDVMNRGERLADDVIDRHDASLEKVQVFAYACGSALTELGEFVEQAREAAALTDDTPEEVTVEEAQALFDKAQVVLYKFREAYSTLDDVQVAIDDLQELK